MEEWRSVLEKMTVKGHALFPTQKTMSNIAYNLQYLEYLQQTVKELSLSSVLLTQTYKSYIIVAVSVIESILFHLVQCHGSRKKMLFKILKYIEKESLLGVENPFCDDLDRFRKLRNKVHLCEFKDGLSTDYIEFGNKEYTEIRSMLYDIATYDIFNLDDDAKQSFRFLT